MATGSSLRVIGSRLRAAAAMSVERETVLWFRGERMPPLLPDLEELLVVDTPSGARPHGGLAPHHGQPTCPQERRCGSGWVRGRVPSGPPWSCESPVLGVVTMGEGGREEASEGPPWPPALPVLGAVTVGGVGGDWRGASTPVRAASACSLLRCSPLL